MDWNARTIGVIAAALLVIIGVVLVFITEPSGGEGSGASGGAADVSEDTRPYLWHGILLVIIGIVVGVVAWTRGARDTGPSG